MTTILTKGSDAFAIAWVSVCKYKQESQFEMVVTNPKFVNVVKLLLQYVYSLYIDFPEMDKLGL